MLTAVLYNRTITAKTMPQLKRQASIIANRHFNTVDIMEVYYPDAKNNQTIVFHLSRFNHKYPNNTITYGEWR